jgi:hypothetical protein
MDSYDSKFACLPSGTKDDSAVVAKHTPGPWMVVEIEPDAMPKTTFEVSVRGNPFWIAYVQIEPNLPSKANAHLIAAAPEMYEALKVLDSMWAGEGYKTPESRTLALWKQIRAAIAKVEGRA